MNSEERKRVVSLKNGDIHSFREFFHLFHKKIYNTSRNMGMAHEEAEGIVQDVFLNMWEKKHTLDENLSVNALLITITRRLVFKKIRRKIYDSAHRDFLIGADASSTNQTENDILFEDIKKYAEKGIDQLPEMRKKIFLMSRQNGLSNAEIAKSLNISKRTVENHLYRAGRFIKEYMTKEGINIGLTTFTILLRFYF